MSERPFLLRAAFFLITDYELRITDRKGVCMMISMRNRPSPFAPFPSLITDYGLRITEGKGVGIRTSVRTRTSPLALRPYIKLLIWLKVLLSFHKSLQ